MQLYTAVQRLRALPCIFIIHGNNAQCWQPSTFWLIKLGEGDVPLGNQWASLGQHAPTCHLRMPSNALLCLLQKSIDTCGAARHLQAGDYHNENFTFGSIKPTFIEWDCNSVTSKAWLWEQRWSGNGGQLAKKLKRVGTVLFGVVWWYNAIYNCVQWYTFIMTWSSVTYVWLNAMWHGWCLVTVEVWDGLESWHGLVVKKRIAATRLLYNAF